MIAPAETVAVPNSEREFINHALAGVFFRWEASGADLMTLSSELSAAAARAARDIKDRDCA